MTAEMEKPMRGNQLPHAVLGNALGEMRAGEITGQRASRHDRSLRPIDEPGRDEPGGGHDVDQRAQHGLERIHLVDVGEARGGRARPA